MLASLEEGELVVWNIAPPSIRSDFVIVSSICSSRREPVSQTLPAKRIRFATCPVGSFRAGGPTPPLASIVIVQGYVRNVTKVSDIHNESNCSSGRGCLYSLSTSGSSTILMS